MNNSTETSTGLRLRPGNGVLARHEGLALLCEVPPGGEAGVRDILAKVKAAASADQPGRHMIRHLVKTLASSGDQLPSLCAFGAVDDGVAIAVHGKARLRVIMQDGELRLNGEDAVTMVDRVVVEPVRSISGEIGEELPGLCEWSELDSGVVRADALEYGLIDELGPDAEPGSEPGGKVEAGSDVDAESGAAEPTGEPVVPEPVAQDGAVADDAPPHADDGSLLVGVSCAKGHFNNAADQYCGVCGIGLTQAGSRSAQQERPSLGVLVLDDGTLLPMTKDYVIGRAPESAADASAEDVVLLRLRDSLVSDVHAMVRLDGWDVALTDAGSTNGTFMREPGSDWCVQVPTGGKTVLRPGAIVTVGRRQFRYDSHRRP